MEAHDSMMEFEHEIFERYGEELQVFKTANNDRVAPKWAFQIAPAIPFVGSAYGRGALPGVLIYSSAENLSYIWEKDWLSIEWLKDEESQMRRSRIYNMHERGTNVHIGPINDGAQLKVARQVLKCLSPSAEFSVSSAEAFLEQVAVANPGKYSIFSPTNSDYPKDLSKFKEMVPFIQADLDVLRPSILIIPGTIFSTLRRTSLKDRLAEIPTVVLISQVQPRPIRRWRKPCAIKEEWCVNTVPYRWDVPAHADQYVQWIEERKMTTNWGERVI